MGSGFPFSIPDPLSREAGNGVDVSLDPRFETGEGATFSPPGVSGGAEVCEFPVSGNRSSFDRSDSPLSFPPGATPFRVPTHLTSSPSWQGSRSGYPSGEPKELRATLDRIEDDLTRLVDSRFYPGLRAWTEAVESETNEEELRFQIGVLERFKDYVEYCRTMATVILSYQPLEAAEGGRVQITWREEELWRNFSFLSSSEDFRDNPLARVYRALPAERRQAVDQALAVLNSPDFPFLLKPRAVAMATDGSLIHEEPRGYAQRILSWLDRNEPKVRSAGFEQLLLVDAAVAEAQAEVAAAQAERRVPPAVLDEAVKRQRRIAESFQRIESAGRRLAVLTSLAGKRELSAAEQAFLAGCWRVMAEEAGHYVKTFGFLHEAFPDESSFETGGTIWDRDPFRREIRNRWKKFAKTVAGEGYTPDLTDPGSRNAALETLIQFQTMVLETERARAAWHLGEALKEVAPFNENTPIFRQASQSVVRLANPIFRLDASEIVRVAGNAGGQIAQAALRQNVALRRVHLEQGREKIVSSGHFSSGLIDRYLGRLDRALKLFDEGRTGDAVRVFNDLVRSDATPLLELETGLSDAVLFTRSVAIVAAAGLATLPVGAGMSLLGAGARLTTLASAASFVVAEKAIQSRWVGGPMSVEGDAAATALVWMKEIAAMYGLFRVLGATARFLNKSFANLMARKALDRMVAEGVIRAGVREINPAQAALFKTYCELNFIDHLARTGVLFGGEVGAMTGWEAVSEPVAQWDLRVIPHVLSSEAMGHRVAFLLGLKLAHVFKRPFEELVHEEVRDFVGQKYFRRLENYRARGSQVLDEYFKALSTSNDDGMEGALFKLEEILGEIEGALEELPQIARDNGLFGQWTAARIFLEKSIARLELLLRPVAQEMTVGPSERAGRDEVLGPDMAATGALALALGRETHLLRPEEFVASGGEIVVPPDQNEPSPASPALESARVYTEPPPVLAADQFEGVQAPGERRGVTEVRVAGKEEKGQPHPIDGGSGGGLAEAQKSALVAVLNEAIGRDPYDPFRRLMVAQLVTGEKTVPVLASDPNALTVFLEALLKNLSSTIGNLPRKQAPAAATVETGAALIRFVARVEEVLQRSLWAEGTPGARVLDRLKSQLTLNPMATLFNEIKTLLLLGSNANPQANRLLGLHGLMESDSKSRQVDIHETYLRTRDDFMVALQAFLDFKGQFTHPQQEMIVHYQNDPHFMAILLCLGRMVGNEITESQFFQVLDEAARWRQEIGSRYRSGHLLEKVAKLNITKMREPEETPYSVEAELRVAVELAKETGVIEFSAVTQTGRQATPDYSVTGQNGGGARLTFVVEVKTVTVTEPLGNKGDGTNGLRLVLDKSRGQIGASVDRGNGAHNRVYILIQLLPGTDSEQLRKKYAGIVTARQRNPALRVNATIYLQFYRRSKKIAEERIVPPIGGGSFGRPAKQTTTADPARTQRRLAEAPVDHPKDHLPEIGGGAPLPGEPGRPATGTEGDDSQPVPPEERWPALWPFFAEIASGRPLSKTLGKHLKEVGVDPDDPRIDEILAYGMNDPEWQIAEEKIIMAVGGVRLRHYVEDAKMDQKTRGDVLRSIPEEDDYLDDFWKSIFYKRHTQADMVPVWKFFGQVIKEHPDFWTRYYVTQLLVLFPGVAKGYMKNPVAEGPSFLKVVEAGLQDPHPLVAYGAWRALDRFQRYYQTDLHVDESRLASPALSLVGPSEPFGMARYVHGAGGGRLAQGNTFADFGIPIGDVINAPIKNISIDRIQPIHSLADYQPDPALRRPVMQAHYEHLQAIVREAGQDKEAVFSRFFSVSQDQDKIYVVSLSSGHSLLLQGHHRMAALYKAAENGVIPKEWLQSIPLPVVSYGNCMPATLFLRIATLGVTLEWRDLFPPPTGGAPRAEIEALDKDARNKSPAPSPSTPDTAWPGKAPAVVAGRGSTASWQLADLVFLPHLERHLASHPAFGTKLHVASIDKIPGQILGEIEAETGEVKPLVLPDAESSRWTRSPNGDVVAKVRVKLRSPLAQAGVVLRAEIPAGERDQIYIGKRDLPGGSYYAPMYAGSPVLTDEVTLVVAIQDGDARPEKLQDGRTVWKSHGAAVEGEPVYEGDQPVGIRFAKPQVITVLAGPTDAQHPTDYWLRQRILPELKEKVRNDLTSQLEGTLHTVMDIHEAGELANVWADALQREIDSGRAQSDQISPVITLLRDMGEKANRWQSDFVFVGRGDPYPEELPPDASEARHRLDLLRNSLSKATPAEEDTFEVLRRYVESDDDNPTIDSPEVQRRLAQAIFDHPEDYTVDRCERNAAGIVGRYLSPEERKGARVVIAASKEANDASYFFYPNGGVTLKDGTTWPYHVFVVLGGRVFDFDYPGRPGAPLETFVREMFLDENGLAVVSVPAEEYLAEAGRPGGPARLAEHFWLRDPSQRIPLVDHVRLHGKGEALEPFGDIPPRGGIRAAWGVFREVRYAGERVTIDYEAGPTFHPENFAEMVGRRIDRIIREEGATLDEASLTIRVPQGVEVSEDPLVDAITKTLRPLGIRGKILITIESDTEDPSQKSTRTIDIPPEIGGGAPLPGEPGEPATETERGSTTEPDGTTNDLTVVTAGELRSTYVVGNTRNADVIVQGGVGEQVYCVLEKVSDRWVVRPVGGAVVQVRDSTSGESKTISGPTEIPNDVIIGVAGIEFRFEDPELIRILADGGTTRYTPPLPVDQIRQRWDDYDANTLSKMRPEARLALLERVHLINFGARDLPDTDPAPYSEFWGSKEIARFISGADRQYYSPGDKVILSAETLFVLDEAKGRWDYWYHETKREIYTGKLEGQSRFEASGIREPVKEVVTFYHVGNDPVSGEYSASLTEGLLYGGALNVYSPTAIWAIDVPMAKLEEIMGGAVENSHSRGAGWDSGSIRLGRNIKPEFHGLRRIGAVKDRKIIFQDALEGRVTLYGNLRHLGGKYTEVAGQARRKGVMPAQVQRVVTIENGAVWDLERDVEIDYGSWPPIEHVPTGGFDDFISQRPIRLLRGLMDRFDAIVAGYEVYTAAPTFRNGTEEEVAYFRTREVYETVEEMLRVVAELIDNLPAGEGKSLLNTAREGLADHLGRLASLYLTAAQVVELARHYREAASAALQAMNLEGDERHQKLQGLIRELSEAGKYLDTISRRKADAPGATQPFTAVDRRDLLFQQVTDPEFVSSHLRAAVDHVRRNHPETVRDSNAFWKKLRETLWEWNYNLYSLGEYVDYRSLYDPEADRELRKRLGEVDGTPEGNLEGIHWRDFSVGAWGPSGLSNFKNPDGRFYLAVAHGHEADVYGFMMNEMKQEADRLGYRFVAKLSQHAGEYGRRADAMVLYWEKKHSRAILMTLMEMARKNPGWLIDKTPFQTAAIADRSGKAVPGLAYGSNRRTGISSFGSRVATLLTDLQLAIQKRSESGHPPSREEIQRMYDEISEEGDFNPEAKHTLALRSYEVSASSEIAEFLIGDPRHAASSPEPEAGSIVP